MKPVKLVVLATWMVEHLTFGLSGEALSGDLLEELRHGRSAQWYWRQVYSAIAAGVLTRLRGFALPLIFCAAWTLLYPAWDFQCRAILVRAIPNSWTVLVWPYSALLPLSCGMAPALAFVWLGYLVYMLVRPRASHEVTSQRLMGGLSASLNVLLVFTYLLLQHFRQSRIDLRSLMREDFYSAFHLRSISIPLALSLLAALSFTVARSPRLMRRQRRPCLQPVRSAPHGIEIFCLVLIAASTRLLQSQERSDSSPHTVQLVTVDRDIKLEVLDWGGTGRPLIFLAGL